MKMLALVVGSLGLMTAAHFDSWSWEFHIAYWPSWFLLCCLVYQSPLKASVEGV